MPQIELKSGQEKTINTSGLYLSIVNSTGGFVVKADYFGELAGKVGRQYKLPNVSNVEFVNRSDTDIFIEYESSNIEVSTSGQGVVRVENEIVVKKILEAIQVNANATVENGKMARFVPNQFAELPVSKQVVPAGQTREIFGARSALGRTCLIQLITNNSDVGIMRIGSTSENAVNGFWFQGNKDAPQAYEWETETSVFVHNPNGFDIDLVGGEVWRA